MNTELIIFKKHLFSENTFVFQYDGKKYIITIYQIFTEENKNRFFKDFEVEEKYQNDINEALNELNNNVNSSNLNFILNVCPKFIMYVEYEHQTNDMVNKVVDNDISCFKYINPKLQNYEMALIAVKESESNIQYVREDLLTEELCKLAL